MGTVGRYIKDILKMHNIVLYIDNHIYTHYELCKDKQKHSYAVDWIDCGKLNIPICTFVNRKDTFRRRLLKITMASQWPKFNYGVHKCLQIYKLIT